MESSSVLIIPCSGIGKVHGLISREAVFQATEELGAETAGTLCLGLVVTRDEGAVQAIQTHPCITVDGCPKLCSFKNVKMAGGKIAKSVRVVDAFKEHKGAQPGTATALTDDGWAVTADIAQDLADEARLLCGAEKGA